VDWRPLRCVLPPSRPHPFAGGIADLVTLDRDHPGFRDPEYRARRNAIARLALDFHEGDPLPDVPYLAAEHEVWRTVHEHLAPLHAAHASAEAREFQRLIPLDPNAIPALATVNAMLAPSGMRMLPVAGLVTPRAFMVHLARGIFLSTQYMRHHSAPLYTPEPDVIHELVGHAGSLAHPAIAALSRAFGRASEEADEATLEQVTRLYWYTLEFGLVREGGALRAYGAGLLSSFGELGRFETEARIEEFRIDRIIETPFDPTDYQRVLFVAPSFGRMVDDVLAWLALAGARVLPPAG
jgi:phenylalanine-4-hydroxylase